MMEAQRFEPEGRKPIVKVVDLFCGAGGLAFGLKSTGFQIVAGVDLDPACRYPFEANCGGEFAEKSVSEVTAKELNAWFAGPTSVCWQVAHRASPSRPIRKVESRQTIAGPFSASSSGSLGRCVLRSSRWRMFPGWRCSLFGWSSSAP